MCFYGFLSWTWQLGPVGEKIPWKLNYSNSTHCKYTNSAQHLAAFGMNKCGEKHTYYGVDLIAVVAMVWYGSTVTLIYIIISGISRSLQTYLNKLSGENTIVIKVRFIHA